MVRRLLEDGKSVRVLDDFSTGRMENLEDILDQIDLIEGDLRDTQAVEKAVDGVRNVLHAGALASVVRSVEDPITTSQVNACGTLRLLMASRDAGIERFVYSSSSSVYGDTPTLPKREDMVPMPLSPYAVQKLTGEYYCGIYHDLYGLKTFCLRYFNVFGPRQDPESPYSAVIPLFIDALKNDRPPVIYGDGNQTRDFTYVDDVVSANIRCCSAPDEAAGGVYNIAREDRMSINDLVHMLMSIMDKNIKPVYEDARPGDVQDSQGDVSRTQEILGWRAQTGFEDGLKKTVEHFVNG